LRTNRYRQTHTHRRANHNTSPPLPPGEGIIHSECSQSESSLLALRKYHSFSMPIHIHHSSSYIGPTYMCLLQQSRPKYGSGELPKSPLRSSAMPDEPWEATALKLEMCARICIDDSYCVNV